MTGAECRCRVCPSFPPSSPFPPRPSRGGHSHPVTGRVVAVLMHSAVLGLPVPRGLSWLLRGGYSDLGHGLVLVPQRRRRGQTHCCRSRHSATVACRLDASRRAGATATAPEPWTLSLVRGCPLPPVLCIFFPLRCHPPCSSSSASGAFIQTSGSPNSAPLSRPHAGQPTRRIASTQRTRRPMWRRPLRGHRLVSTPMPIRWLLPPPLPPPRRRRLHQRRRATVPRHHTVRIMVTAVVLDGGSGGGSCSRLRILPCGYHRPSAPCQAGRPPRSRPAWRGRRG